MRTIVAGRLFWGGFLSLPLIFLLVPIQLQAGDSIKGNIENGKPIAEKQCDRCHGKDGKTVAGEIPVLAGQQFDYLVSTMEYFRDGSRSNDPGGTVQVIIRKLSEVEIDRGACQILCDTGRKTC